MADDKKKLPDIPAEEAAGDLTDEQAKEAAADDPLARAYIDTDENGRFVIRIDPKSPEYDPTLDPESPEFDREKWEEYQRQASESLKTASESLKAAAERMKTTIAEAMRPAPEMGAAVRQIQEGLQGLAEAAAAAAQPFTFTAMQEYFNSDAWRRMLDTLELSKEVKELTPYLNAELKKPEYEGKTLDDLLEEAETDDDGNPAAESLLMKAVSAARAARDEAAAKEETPHATITRAQTVEYPLDKPNQIIWNLLEKDTKGQVTFNMAKSGSRKQILTYYSINFDGLSDIQITKRLLPFDKRVYIAVSALFNAGNNVITLSQIYYAMGYTGRPGTTDLEKINDAITKMTTARIYFDNQQEAESYKYRHFKYDGSLLPLERGTVIVNGQLADAAIKIFREPPLITFAKQRQQITTLDVKLLQSPISKTDANLSIEDYLIERISREENRRGAHSCRILFKTLYTHAGIPDKPKTNTEKSAKKRAPDKIKKYLTYYQKQQFITRFTTETDGITVYW